MRPPYAIAARRNDGFQTAYNAGLSWFPDYGVVPEPMGLIQELADVGGGFAVGGPAGGAVAIGTTLVSLFTNGSRTDQERQARVNYFLNQAQQGNVAAAQLILGGPNNVSGNERSMWENAAQILSQSPMGAGVLQAARAAGPYWMVGSGDTATNYPGMKSFTSSWALTNHPLDTAVTSIFGPGVAGSAIGGMSPLILAGIIGGVLLLATKRRRS